MLPISALAANEDVVQIDNGYIEVSVSTKNGGFHVNTVEGNLLRKSDNNKNLLYHSGRYDTSFVSFRVGSGANAKDYLFGGQYPGSSEIVVTKMASGELVAAWAVDGITFTQTISLAAENSSEHGMVSISLSAMNTSGAAVPIQARILLDTCLGDQDYAHYQINGGAVTHTLDTEQIITDEAALRSFYALDDLANPGVTAYVVSNPAKVAIAHWNNLAASLFDFAPDTSMNFTNPINVYLTADSACALYYDLGTVANGAAKSAVGYYGVYSNHTVKLQNSVAINAVAPMRLTLNDSKTAYVRESNVGSADFAVTVSAENFKSGTSRELSNVILAVHSSSGLRSLSDSGTELGIDYESTDPLMIPYDRIAEGETITKTLYFQAKKGDSTSYERITIGMYQGEVTSENLLGERYVYLLLPGGDGSIPKVCFNSMTPEIIYNAGTRHLYVAVTNALLLSDALDAGHCVFMAYSTDGKKAWEIPSDNITVDVSAGVADVALTDELKLAVGSWKLQLEWTDEAVSQEIVASTYQKQTADKLKFQISDNPKYKNDTYGVLAAVKYGKGTTQYPYYYRLQSFADESSYKQFAEAKEHEWVEIPLVLRGAFTADQRYGEKGENGKLLSSYYYSAVSKKSVDPKTRETNVDNPITINNCVDFEGGSIAIYYENYESKDAVSSAICVEFDGDLYTSDARTSIWTGKAALTKLEQGGDFALIHYDANGNRKQSDATPITLIWPNVFGMAQTLAGMAFKLAYGQFGVMEKDGKEIGRVISFAASLSLSFLRSPEGDKTDYGTASYFGRMQELWKDWRGASIYQYAYHGGRYEKLVDIGMNDRNKSEETQQGVQTSVMVPDILFGCGEGFVGLNFTVDVTVRNMVESLAKIEAALSINTINNWSFGMEGKCELIDDIKMEAKLKFKSYNNIPVPDELYFYVGGFKPGLCIDPCGVVWITGAGGGFSGLYDTIFYTGGIQPLKLIMTMSFAALQILEGTAKMEVSGSGVNITASNLKIQDTIEVVKKISVGLQWYPDLKLTGAVYVSMFERTIEGQGYMIILGKNYTDWFFEMFVRAALQIPDSIPVVGGMVIAAVDLGVSTEKIWGALEALKIVVGVTYYWGEDSVDFGSGSKAHPTYPNLLLNGYDGECEDFPIAYDEENGRTLYAHFGTNFESPRSAQILSDGDLILMGTEGVFSNGSKTSHRFNLGAYNGVNNASTVVQISYHAESPEEAESLARSFTVIDENQTAFPLTFYDGTNLDSANANVSWDADTTAEKNATFAFTVTDANQFGKDWNLSTGQTKADVVLYNVLPVPEVTEVSASGPLAAGSSTTIRWAGTGLEELDSISFFLVTSEDPAEDAGYPVGSAVTEGIGAGSVTLTVPGDVPAGEYYLRAVYSKDDQLNGIVHSNGKITVTNPNTPADAGAILVTPAGDLRYNVTIPETDDPNTTGYAVTVYNADGSATDITGMTFDKAESGDTILTVGGSYTAPVRSSADDPDSAVNGTETVGLEAGRNYRIGVTPYQTLDTDWDGEPDTIVYGEETVVSAGTLPQAVTPTAVLTAEGQTMTALADMAEGDPIPVFTSGDLEIAAAFSETVNGSWTLDNGEVWSAEEGSDADLVSGSFADAAETAISLRGLSDGSHILRVSGQAADDGDRFAYEYHFTVDTTAPRLLLSAPLNGSVFGKNGALEIAGVTDTDALLTVTIDGRTVIDGQTVEQAGGTLDTDGVFSINTTIPDPNSAATHTVVISAADENGNCTEEQVITVAHPGLGDLVDLVLMADGSVPADGNIATAAAGTAQLTLLGVTSDGTRFVLDSDIVYWNCIAAEGAASVDADGMLTYDAYTKGYVEAMVEVTAGAYRSAALTLGSEPQNGYVAVSSTVGGTAEGGGYYAVGETVTLTAIPDEGYVFDCWEITGVTANDLTSETVTFTMPSGSVEAKANFKAEGAPEEPEYTVSFDTDGGSTVAPQTVKNGKTAAKPADPTKEGYTFGGWYLGETAYDFSTPVTKNITLKAKWTEKSNPAPGPNVPYLPDESRIGYAGVPEDVDPNRYVPYTIDADGNKTIIPISSVMEDGRLAYLKPVGGQVFFMENPVTFSDLDGHWAEDNIIWTAAHGLFNGIGGGRFNPQGTMTRAMFVTVLYRMAGSPKVTGTGKFADVPADTWYTDAVTWASANGIVNGVSDTEFAPNRDVNREQMCAMVARFLRTFGYALKLGEKVEFKDAGLISSWAAADVEYCQRAGIINGKPGGVFDPKANATRAENATVMKRMVEAIITSLK